MPNVKISAKGKELLRSSSSGKIVKAIATAGDKLSTEEGLTVKLDDGRTVKLRSAPVYTDKTNKPE